MEYIKLNIDWDADPNAPEPIIIIQGSNLIVEFYLNYFIHPDLIEGDKARLTFINCFKYSFNSINDEGYYAGQYRYNHKELPWGNFYQINTNSETDFPEDQIILSPKLDSEACIHFISFFRDNLLECIAESYMFEKLA